VHPIGVEMQVAESYIFLAFEEVQGAGVRIKAQAEGVVVDIVGDDGESFESLWGTFGDLSRSPDNPMLLPGDAAGATARGILGDGVTEASALNLVVRIECSVTSAAVSLMSKTSGEIVGELRLDLQPSPVAPAI